HQPVEDLIDLRLAHRPSAPSRSRLSFATVHRNREGEHRALTELAVHPDPAPVQLDELPTQRQPEPRTLHLLRRRPNLTEPLEPRLLILLGDADPGIAD